MHFPPPETVKKNRRLHSFCLFWKMQEITERPPLERRSFLQFGVEIMKKYLTSGNFIWFSDLPQIANVSLDGILCSSPPEGFIDPRFFYFYLFFFFSSSPTFSYETFFFLIHFLTYLIIRAERKKFNFFFFLPNVK